MFIFILYELGNKEIETCYDLAYLLNWLLIINRILHITLQTAAGGLTVKVNDTEIS